MLKRYGMLTAGVILGVLGISLITKTGLGASPTISLAFVLTFILPYSLGVFTMMINSVMFIIQVVLLGESFQKIRLLQLPVALLLSVCIGDWLRPLPYWQTGGHVGEIPMLLLDCAFLGLGITLEAIPNVLILPGEGFVRTIADLIGWGFDHVKTGFDMSTVASTAVVSVLVKGQVLGIREGTVTTTLIVGSIFHFFIEKVSAASTGRTPNYSETTDVMTS